VRLAPRLPVFWGQWHKIQAYWGPAVPQLPHLPASPTPGVDSKVVRLGETPQQLTQHPILPANSPNSNVAPSWASVVRDGGVASLALTAAPAATTAEFFALYEGCVSDGLEPGSLSAINMATKM
jgi:hypothetical protein